MAQRTNDEERKKKVFYNCETKDEKKKGRMKIREKSDKKMGKCFGLRKDDQKLKVVVKNIAFVFFTLLFVVDNIY